jgi:hypothetical protein
MTFSRAGWLAFFTLLVACVPAGAHPVPFSFVDVRVQPDSLDVMLVAHVFDVAHEVGLDPPERLLEGATLAGESRAIADFLRTRFQISVDGRKLPPADWSAAEALVERQSVRLHARVPLSHPAGSIAVSAALFPYDPKHQTFVNFYEQNAVTSQAILDREHDSVDYFTGTRQGSWAVIQKFLPSGVHHILIGPDHLLFLVGLLLLGGSIRRLLLIVTAFTFAHSLTLSLADIIEPAIALSIVYVGADNLFVRGGRDVRSWIAFAFGLIHGFGFANVLRSMELPARALGWTLFSFNIGVELGQLFVVLIVASGLALLRSRSEVVSRRLAFAGSIVVMAAGAFWFIQRVFFPGGTA